MDIRVQTQQVRESVFAGVLRAEIARPLLGLGTRRLERPGRGRLCPLPSGISSGKKFIVQQAISRPLGGSKAGCQLARGETAYLAGISIGGFHNSGVALVEVTPDAGLRIICNNEEERFSGRKHANNYPSASLEALTDTMRSLSLSPQRIVSWLVHLRLPFVGSHGNSLHA